jgi:hypothetical protein
MMNRWIWVAIAGGLACAACKKEEKKTDQKSGSGPVSNAVGGGPAEAPAPSAQLGGPVGAQGLDRMLAIVPVESEIVFGLDFDRLRASALVGGFMDQLTQMNNKNMGFDMKAECGIDASKLATTAVFGMRMKSENDVSIAGVIGGVPKAQMVPCFQKAKDKMEKQGAKVTLDGNYTFLASEQNGKKSYAGMTFIDDSTMIMKAGMDPVDKAALDKMMTAKVGDGLSGSTEFMGMVKATNTKATIWALVNGQAAMLQKAPIKFKSAFGSIDITDGVVADGRLRMNSPQEATKLAQAFGAQIGQLKGMGLAETAEATADGADLKVKVTMKKEHVDKLKQMMGGMLSGMMGGMGGMRGMGGGGGGGPTGP